MIGQTLAHYKILEKIGSGGMGDVYLAEDTKLDRKIALKVLPSDLAENEERRARFQREAKAIAALDHPNIVTVYSVEEAEGVHFITMQLVRGRTLTELLPKSGVALSKFFDIAIPLADAVAAAHQEGIIHRDLKPGNVMVADDGRVKVLDFGLAKPVGGFADSEAATAARTVEGAIVGTAAYMSPEQSEGKTLDRRTDIFSVGILLYEMATGQRPFRGATTTALLASILRDTPSSVSELNSDIPPELAKLIRRCLVKDPERRYQSVKDIRNELEELEEQAKSVEPVSSVTSPTKPTVRRKALWLAGIVVVIGGIIGSVAVNRDPAPETDRILVTPLENLTGDPTLDDVGFFVADGITGGISRSELFDVVPARTVREEWMTDSSIDALAVELGASTVVSGNYGVSGESLRFQAEIIDVATGNLVVALEPVSVPLDAPTSVIEQLGERAIVALSVRLEVESAWRGIFSKPVSLESWREFTKGLDFFNDENYEDAWSSFERALALDPGHAAAALYAANSLANMGRLEEADAALTRLEPIRDRLTAGESAQEDWVRNFYLLGDLRAEYRAAQELLQLDANGVAGFMAGLAALRNNRPGEAVEHLSRFIESEITSRYLPYWDSLSHAYHRLGDYEKELDVVRRGGERMGNRGLLLHNEVDALAALGRVEALHGVLALAPQQRLRAARELRAHGHADEAAVQLVRALDWYRTRAAEEDVRLGLAQSLYENRQWDEAGALFDELAAETPHNIRFVGWRGVSLARRGQRDTALEVDQQLARWGQPYLKGRHTFWRARIAAVLGDQDDATRLLEKANQEGVPLSLGGGGPVLHTMMDFDPIREYRPFQELVRPKG